MKKSVSDFFGVGDEDDREESRSKWRQRSIRLHSSNKFVGGQVKPELRPSNTIDSVFDMPDGTPTPRPIDPLARPRRQDSQVSRGSHYFPSRQISHISTASSGRRSMHTHQQRKSRRDSVIKMAYDGVKSLVVSDTCFSTSVFFNS